ncbi:unnamed protein product [Ceratitis capitata]|uniref:(Mediterranean fruit fly) hypothetical protein n=1 Tax=Ceratitis capitata TaxID=7213 RepID=A0A811UV99_CERCA|nr:unnamed protein product [Ceratitis capitata]
MKINDYYFSNFIEKDNENIVQIKHENIHNFMKKFTFEDMVEESKNHSRNIFHLKLHSKLSYASNLIILVLIIILICIIFIKHKSIKIVLNKRIQENSNLKEGVVTYRNYNKSTIGDIDQFINRITSIT